MTRRSTKSKIWGCPVELRTKGSYWCLDGKMIWWKSWSTHRMSLWLSRKKRQDGSLWDIGAWDWERGIFFKNQLKLSIYFFPDVYMRILAWVNWALCLGSPKAEISIRLVLTRRIWGRIHVCVLVLSGCWQNSVPSGYRMEVPTSWLSPSPRGDLNSSFYGLLHLQSHSELNPVRASNLSDLFLWVFLLLV